MSHVKTKKTKHIKTKNITVNVQILTHKHMYNLTLDTLNYILQKLTTQMTPINTTLQSFVLGLFFSSVVSCTNT